MSRSKTVLVASLLLCGLATGGQAQTTVDTLKSQGYARIAVANEPPITEVKPDGTVTGAAVEVARAVLKELGINEVTATVSPFNGMIPALQARRFDIVTAGLKMRGARCDAILFSEPDICDAQGLLVKRQQAAQLRSYNDIVASKIRLGVLPASDGLREAREAGVTDNMTVPVPDVQSGLKLLQDGRVDAYLLPTMSLVDLVKKAQDPNLEVIAPLGGSQISCAGAGFRKEDAQLRDAYDAALKKIKASGEFAAIMNRFGLNPELAAKTNRTEMCGKPN